MPEARVLFVMPSNRTVPVEVMDSFAGAFDRGLVEGVVTAKLVIGDTYIDLARNLIVTQALKLPTHPTHIFWMDDDQIVPSDVVERLIAHNMPIVGGLYHERVPPFRPIAFNFVEDPGQRVGKFIALHDNPTGLVKVDGLGFGATLVPIDIYPEMAKRFGDAWWHQVSTGHGEDFHFFERCKAMGIPVALDCDLRCGHVRRETVGTLHYESYRKAHQPPSSG